MSPQSGDAATDALAAAKLAGSGLGWAAAAALRIRAHRLATEVDASFPPRPCLGFTYSDPWTGQPAEFLPGWGPYRRVRLLDLPAAGFAAQAAPGAKPVNGAARQPKYLQPPDSGLMAYFPSTIAWPAVLADPAQPLLLTEGELKAAAACQAGFPTIGLGGVSSFQSARYGLVLVPALERIVWAKRRVYLVFDNDHKVKPDVIAALNKLAELLAARGALPFTVPLPRLEGLDKTGLDDFLVAQRAAGLQEVLDSNALSLTLARALWALNDEVIYIRDPGLVLVQGTGQKLAPAPFQQHAYGHKTSAEQVVRDNGSVSLKQVALGEHWLRWPLRREAQRLTYAPGEPPLLDPAGSGSAWNTWPGWGLTPTAGDVSPFLRLIDHLFTGAEPAAQRWFLQWLAYPLQQPGTKLFSTVLLWGVRHGTGKSIIGEVMGRIYGQNYTELDQTALYGGFNEWAESKQFVMGDDVSGTDKRQDNDRLKKFITQSQLRINIKHVPSFVVPDCINYYFTANQPTAFFLEDDDRRSFIHEVAVGPLDEMFYVDLKLWKDTTGPAALFDYLLRLDTSDFNPAAPALRTGAKERMIADSRSDLGDWVARLLAAPDDLLRVGAAPLWGDLFTNKELLALYDPDGRTGTTANGLGRELRRVGVALALDGGLVRSRAGQNRYYIIRDRPRWKAADFMAITEHVREREERALKPRY